MITAMRSGTGVAAASVERMAGSGTPRTPQELIADRSKPGELTALARRLERTGGCRRPIRLVGKSQNGGYSSQKEPDGVLLVACGTRHVSRCPACAATYRGDARQVVLSGLQGGKGVPDSVAEHPMVFFTLTGESFGAVHSARQGPCHLGPPGRCPHGVSRHCLVHHEPDEETVGSPLCARCFDYQACVLFNAAAGELWRRVAIYAFRHLAYAIGVTERQLRGRVRLSFVKVSEFQRRGAVHLHGVLRADAADDELAPPEGITHALLAEALVRAVQATRVTRSVGERSVVLRFGSQLSVERLDAAGSRRVASYVSKYAVKGVEETGVLDRRIREEELELLRLPEHLRTLVATAFALGRTPENEACRRWAHALGWSGHVLTKSRRWSTTFCALRLARREWRMADEGEAPATGTTRWSFEGVGLRCEIDRMLALGIEEQHREGRLQKWWERCDAARAGGGT
jgi:hypothetical protein